MAKITKTSPFAPKAQPDLLPVAGVRLAACEAGIKYKGRKDLTLAIFDAGTIVAGTLTSSKTCSAAVDWCRSHLERGAPASALVVNSGNANAFTGMRGRQSVEETAKFAAESVGCTPDEVMIASTGVIGEPMSTQAFSKNLALLADQAGPDAISDAAAAIMTTDTYPKAVSRKVGDVTITGIAKGSGMIAPDMATMLAFIFTDAKIDLPDLQAMVSEFVHDTFNAITVDSDTSTSDTLLVFATQKQDVDQSAFREALFGVMHDLAMMIIKDGEGISKFVTYIVEDAESDTAARKIAMALANSPILKCALAGEDPNWGRVVMAVGKAGEAADRDKLAIWFGDIEVARNGEVSPAYTEQKGSDYMRNSELEIKVSVGVGTGRSKAYGCDLTHDYISINADYRS